MAVAPDYQEWDQPVEYHLLRHTLAALKRHLLQLSNVHKNGAIYGDYDRTAGSYDRCRFLDKELNSLALAERELALIREVINAGDTLETAIAASQLRLDRLQEEHDWLRNEEQHFERKMRLEKLRCEHLRKHIAHVAFIFNHRKEWNGNSLPITVYGLPQVGKEESKSTSTLFGRIHPTTIRYMHNASDFKPLLSANSGCDMNDMTEIPSMGDGDKINQDASSSSETSNPTPNENSSNSGPLTLAELKNLLLMDKPENRKRPKVIKSFKKIKAVKVKVKPKRVELEGITALDEDQKEAITDYLKQKMPSIYGSSRQQEGEGISCLDLILRSFLRSPKRSANMNALVQVINHFLQKDGGTSGLSLCWMAITILKAHELELRKCTNADVSSSTGTGSNSRSKGSRMKSEHKKVIEDITRLLTLLGQQYKARDDLKMSIKCFKDILKIKRETNSLMDPSTANTYHHLSVVQALSHCQAAAIISARKAVRIRKQLLQSEMLMLDSTTEQLAIARENTHLALLCMHKQENEQKRLRYRRLPQKNNEVPVLLNKAISIIMSLSQIYVNNLAFVTNDLDYSTSEPIPSTLGDSRDTFRNEHYLNPMNECLFVAQNALAIYYILTKKCLKAVRLLNSNLEQIDRIMPDSKIEHLPKSRRPVVLAIKLTCLKSLVYALGMTESGVKQTVLVDRIRLLDRYYRESDEVTEFDMIRMCQSALLS